MMDEAINLLRDLAAKLGQTVEELWPHAVRYQAVSALTWIGVWTAVFLAAGALMLSQKKQSYWIDNDTPTAKFIFTVLFFFALITWVGVMGTNLPIVLEPTGYTVTGILGRVR